MRLIALELVGPETLMLGQGLPPAPALPGGSFSFALYSRVLFPEFQGLSFHLNTDLTIRAPNAAVAFCHLLETV